MGVCMIIPCLTIIVGILILYSGMKKLKTVKKWADKMNSICYAKITDVEIVDFTNDHGYKMTYEALVNGKHIVFKDKMAGNVRRRIGKTVKIKYDSKNPNNFSLACKDSRFTFPAVIIFMGGVIAFTGITMLVSVM